MKKLVNGLTIFRIVAAFALIPLLYMHWFWLMFILFVLAGASDFFDGFLAKKYNVVSKLGGIMDEIGDKLLVAVSSVLIAMFLQLWVIFIPVILIICRNLYVSGLREFLGANKMEMPVPHARMSWGKVATFTEMTAIGALFLFVCLLPIWPASQILYYFLWLCIAGLWFSLAASLTAAVQYTIDFVAKFKKIK